MRLFVRWNAEREGYDTVELVDEYGDVIQRETFCHNRDRLYGYCCGVVTTLQRTGVPIEMPQCLSGHRAPDTTRQD
ncbi:MAG: hypothetical protein HY566_01655 [Candidatus Kerfeldbacteria bacterium]|nr:hypothetical protein [Candidatus Kerfeldbacteria bacterium]